MKYRSPVLETKENISINIITDHEDHRKYIDSALSAIYYHETKFAGDVVLFLMIKFFNNKYFVDFANLSVTYLSMHKTLYMGDEIKYFTIKYLKTNSYYLSEIKEILSEIRERLKITKRLRRKSIADKSI